MNQLTIRGLEPALEREVRNLAQEEGLSLNQAVLRLLSKGAGLDPASKAGIDRVGSSLDSFIGSWSRERADEADGATAVFEGIDPSLWA